MSPLRPPKPIPGRLLLCCDLDRTLLPNGDLPESPLARPLLRALCALPELSLCYVSGRDLSRLQQAQHDYQLPTPDYAIGDVGSSLYHVTPTGWQYSSDWQQLIARDWHGRHAAELMPWLADIDTLTTQETSKQGDLKLSYYTPTDIDRGKLLTNIRQRLALRNLNANLIWSLDETNGTGLLDILPPSANKLHAIRYLMRQPGLHTAQTVFAGDSGNDLDVLASAIPGILVANATDAVRRAAITHSRQANTSEQLYLAHGNWLGMNGNYSAGVIEGLCHYHPRYQSLLAEIIPRLSA